MLGRAGWREVAGPLGSCVWDCHCCHRVPVAAEGTEQEVAAHCVWNKSSSLCVEHKHCPGKMEIHPGDSPAGCSRSEPRAGIGPGRFSWQRSPMRG